MYWIGKERAQSQVSSTGFEGSRAAASQKAYVHTRAEIHGESGPKHLRATYLV